MTTRSKAAQSRKPCTSSFPRKRLDEIEAGFSLFANLSSESFALLDGNLTFLRINTAAEKLLGVSRKAVEGKNITEIVPDIKESGRYDKYLNVVKTGEPFFADEIASHTRFGDVYVRVNAYKVEDLVAVIATDITEKTLLARYNAGLVELSPEEDLFRFIGENLKVIAGDAVVIINSFDKESKTSCIRFAAGMEKHAQKVKNMLGADYIGLRAPISKAIWLDLTTGKLQNVVGGLYELACGAIPQTVCNRIEKALGLTDAYAIGFTWQGELYGSAIVLMRNGAKPRYPEAIEELAKQSSVALQRWLAYEALKQREGYFHSLTDNAVDVILVIGADGVRKYVSPSIERVRGYKPAELIGKEAMEGIHPDDVPKIADIFVQLTENPGKLLQWECRLRHKDGSWRIVEGISRSLFDNPAVAGIVSNFRDITERKKAEQKLRIGEQRLASFMNSSPESFLFFDSELNLVDLNKLALDRWGINKEDVVGKNMLELLPGIEKTDRYKKYKAVLDTGEPFELEEYVPHPSFEYTERFLSLKAFKMGDGLGLIARDITERKKAEEELRDSEERHRTIVELAPDCIVTADMNGVVTSINPAFTKLTGYSEDEIVGKHFSELPTFRAVDIPRYMEMFVSSKTREEPPEPFEFIWVHKDGSPRWGEIHTSLMYSGGEVVGSQLIARDITERKWGEKQGELSRKLLEILNRGGDQRQLIRDILMLIKEFSGFEAVGIRINAGEDFPYYETNGFGEDFVRSESRLCAYDLNGQLLRDEVGNPLLECMCGNIICGRFDPQKPFFTQGGSFWTNSTTELLASTTEADRLDRTRDRCNGEGYESVALIPLKSQGTIIGLLQLNDKRRDRFTQQIIEYYEGIGQSIGILLARKMAEEELRESEERYRNLFNTAEVALYRSRIADGKILECNELLAKMFGYSSREQCLAEHITSEHYVDPGVRAQKLTRMLEKGKVDNFEAQVTRRDGSPFWASYSAHIYPERDCIEGAIVDITERKKAEDTLSREKLLSEGIVSNIPAGIAFLDNDFVLRKCNDVYADLIRTYTPFTSEQAIGMSYFDYVPGSREQVEEWFQKVRDTGKAETRYSFKLVLKTDDNERVTYWDTSIAPVFDAHKKVEGILILTQDITERKRAEEKLQASLKEKEALLREVNHRVKNNFQLISSILDMVGMRARNEETVRSCASVHSRVHAMAQVHSQLYKGGSFAQIDMGAYLGELVSYLAQAYSVNGRVITPVVDATDASLPITQAVPCALALNEVLSNSFKHAFAGREKGRVDIAMRRSFEGAVYITVRDDGVGVPEAFDIEKVDTVGLKLARNLVQDQLNGKFQIKRNRGTEVTIEFRV